MPGCETISTGGDVVGAAISTGTDMAVGAASGGSTHGQGARSTRLPHSMSDTDTESVSPAPPAISVPVEIAAPATSPPVEIAVSQPATSAHVEDPVTPSTSSGRHGRKRPCGAGTPREKGPGRKQVRSPSTWIKNVAKKARAKGEAYTSVKTGKLMPAAKIGAPCTCPKKCFKMLGDDKIVTIFKGYYDIGENYSAKSAYLLWSNKIQDCKEM